MMYQHDPNVHECDRVRRRGYGLVHHDHESDCVRQRHDHGSDCALLRARAYVRGGVRPRMTDC